MIDLIQIAVQTVVVPLDANHHIVNWDVGRKPDGVLNVKFLELVSATPEYVISLSTHAFRDRGHVLIIVTAVQKSESEVGRGVHVRTEHLQEILHILVTRFVRSFA